MLKVITIVGTRPELIKMSMVIKKFDKYTQHILVHTGQNYDYELNQIFFEDLEIRKPDHFLNAAGKNSAKTIANVIEKSDEIFEIESPDAILLYGDTNSCLSVISAKKRKIPIFHMEAGNRCFDQRVPEEINRKIVDHLSDINFVLTEHARRYLIREGISSETIIKTGSHMREVLNHYENHINDSKILSELKLFANQYFLVSMHREENVDNLNNLKILIEALNNIAEKYNFPIIVSTHPRTKKNIDNLSDLEQNKLIRFLKPFGFFDYIKLQKESACVISDSGTITEEAYMLNIPAITIREMHERPEGMDAGTLIMTGISKSRILDSVELTIQEHQAENNPEFSNFDYETKRVSNKILKSVFSYTDYVNRNIWKKDL
tara:strand:+ start:60 stop:1190 length:1131 start_codon:yes stop_codon:yes gene_type:complete